MKAILVFIDGTICDTRPRHTLGIGSLAFHQAIHSDLTVPGSVECLNMLTRRYQIVYIGARPVDTLATTQAWLQAQGFPSGPLWLAEALDERMQIVCELSQSYDFLAGIGDRWDDNRLFEEAGAATILVQEYEGEWAQVGQRVETIHRRLKIRENQTHLRGKVEGLARVCPLLLSRYGEGLWRAWVEAVLEMAEGSRENLRQEYLAEYARYGLDPDDLRDAAKLHEYSRRDDWEDDPTYGLQDSVLVEASPTRYVHKITRCLYAELWKAQGRPDIGYQIHCATDRAWWDRPAWNPRVRFEQPQTIMQGDACCLFIQYIP